MLFTDYYAEVSSTAARQKKTKINVAKPNALGIPGRIRLTDDRQFLVVRAGTN
jgi:hypothetical protein